MAPHLSWLLSLACAHFFPNRLSPRCPVPLHLAAKELSSEPCGGQCCAVSPIRNCELLGSPFIKHYVAASILLWQWKRLRYLLHLWMKKMTLSLRPSWILSISKECENKAPILKPVYLNFDGKKGGCIANNKFAGGNL